MTMMGGCSHLVDLGAPSSTLVSPQIVNSYQGAQGLYYGTIGLMGAAATGYAYETGLFTDELHNVNQGIADLADARVGNDTSAFSQLSNQFSGLSKVREQAQQALGALALYPHDASPAMSAELYAIEGMAEVMLTELFCNGIPLATTPYGHDFTYSGAISTHDILTLAIAHFDSALALAQDSAAIVTLASVGKGRALLDLGQFQEAAAAVSSVPTSAQYTFSFNTTNDQNQLYATNFYPWIVVTPGEGINGIHWNFADPRVPAIPASDGVSGSQSKYPQATTPFVMADGVEARLIGAEAELQAKNYTGWIGTLQTLDASVPGVPTPTDPGAMNGSDSARVTLQFQERAYWLFLTGHRQGDTRRLIRQYGRLQPNVVPSGVYTPTSVNVIVYGSDIALAPPKSERQNNPLYTGCLDQHP
jgi:hypothetical protein